MTFTKIIATIGPATSDKKTLDLLLDQGVDIARLNFSHGNHDSHRTIISYLQSLNKSGKHRVAIMLDTKGPEIRTGDVKEPLSISRGDHVLFTHIVTGNEKMKTVKVDYDSFAMDVKNAQSILIDNGAIEFKLLSIKGKNVIAQALEDGKIGSRRHINLPGADVSLPSFTKKDWGDIAFGIQNNVDFIATSFVRTAKDIKELHVYLRKHKSEANIIAKIETRQAVENIDAIIDEADGIMIARGDLGAEVPFEEVPRIQDDIVVRCRQKGKPVIVATHMLESMIQYPMPTRAEVTDIAHAAVSQTDATMLSGETAGGLYPLKAVTTMRRILDANERVDSLDTMVMMQNDMQLPEQGARMEQALAASLLARDLKADALLVFTRQGGTARAVSHWRPLIPIIAFTASENVQRRMLLLWGVDPYVISFYQEDPEKTVQTAMRTLLKRRILRSGSTVVIVSDILTKSDESAMTIQIRTLKK